MLIIMQKLWVMKAFTLRVRNKILLYCYFLCSPEFTLDLKNEEILVTIIRQDDTRMKME